MITPPDFPSLPNITLFRWSQCPLWNNFFCTQQCFLCLFLLILSAVWFTFVSSFPLHCKPPSGGLNYWSYLSLPLFFCRQNNSAAHGKTEEELETALSLGTGCDGWCCCWAELGLVQGRWRWRPSSYLLTHMDISKNEESYSSTREN